MKIKLLCIFIISMFLLTGLTTVSAVEIKNDDLRALNYDNLPDLIIVEGSISIETEKRYDEFFHMYVWYLIIHATVKNIGNAPASCDEPGHYDWWTGFWVDDKKLFDSQCINTLNAGDSRELVCEEEWSEFDRFKDREITVHADWTDYVVESNDNNNDRTISQPIFKSKSTHLNFPTVLLRFLDQFSLLQRFLKF